MKKLRHNERANHVKLDTTEIVSELSPDTHPTISSRNVNCKGKDSSRLLSLCCVALLGCALFVTGFMMDKDYFFDVPDVEHYPFEKCFANPPTQDDILKPSLRVVFMVIDAWRLEFLTSPSSPMNFTRRSIESGRAILFKGFTQTPTVTMPRIKALTCGTVPSFASALLNFAASDAEEDSWVRQAYQRQRRMRFFGDDTWLSLFPEHFDQSEGVTSFFVNDYTEVDNNVTRNMRKQLKDDSWDMLILHYLGLDHIGHSLGGKSAQIPVKLKEMDDIIEEIYTTLSARAPTLLVVVGDHGMTDLGSHGGGSDSEVEVPMLFFHSKAHVKRGHKWQTDELLDAYQLDMASTMSSFLRVPVPKQSRGLTLVPLMGKYWYLEDKTIFFEQLWQAIQLRRYVIHGPVLEEIINAGPTYGYNVCGVAKDLAQEVHMYYSFLRDTQRRIIRALESTWESSSNLGLLSVALVAVVGFEEDLKRIYSDGFKGWSVFDLFEAVIPVFPIVTCFASSLIEEEHEVWYFLASIIIVLRVLAVIRDLYKKENNTDISSESERLDWRSQQVRSLLVDGFIILCLHRLGISFESLQRRRWAMDPAALPPPIFPDTGYLRYVAVVGFPLDMKFLATSLMPATVVMLTCVYFFVRLRQYIRCSHKGSKRRFTYLISFYLLSLAARGVFLSLGLSWAVDHLFYPLLVSVLVIFFSSPSISIILYTTYLVRPQFLPLMAIVFEMGLRSRRIFLERYYLFQLVHSSYYYMGASFSISTIDVGIGYTGLSSYIPVLVGLQIGLNLYAAPIVFLLAYNLYPAPAPNTASLDSRSKRLSPTSAAWNEQPFCFFHACHARVVLCASAMLSMRYFHEHLFVWTVFGPKVLFEVFHTCVVVIFSILLIAYSRLQSWMKRR